MGKRNSCHPVTVEWLGHFRVNPSLCFKARLSAKQVIWIRFFILMKVKLIITNLKVLLLELGSGPLRNEVMMNCILGFLSNRTILVLEGVLGELLFIFKNYYKILQFTTARLITSYDNVLLQFTIAWLLQFSTTVITIYDRYYNLRRLLLQFMMLLQFTTELRLSRAYAVQVWLVGKWEY